MSTLSGVDVDSLRRALVEAVPAARALRRELHSAPRLSGDEGPTTEAVLRHLSHTTRVLQVERIAGTGAAIRIGGSGPAVAVRAELDALPVAEQTGVTWASPNGVMHACGHDVNIAAGAAVACAVQAVRPSVPLLLILQPREEAMPSGALDVLASGVLTGGEASAVVAAHLQPLVDLGSVACTPGAVNASADQFTVVMDGQGGHGAYPHLGADPVLALAQFVVAVQQLVSRDTDPMSPAVVSVGSVSGGTSPNVRPNSAAATGTIRAMSPTHRERLHRRIEEVANGVAVVCGTRATVTIDRGEPVLVNDPKLAELTRTQLLRLDATVSTDVRSCGADDFAYYGEHLPAVMMFVGAGAAAGNLHSSTFLPEDSTVDLCAHALLAGYLGAAEMVQP